MFDYDNAVYITNRLLGTQVSLIGATAASTTCGTINSVNPDEGSVRKQTYTVECPKNTVELSIAVRLYDDVKEEIKNDMIMNIATAGLFTKDELDQSTLFSKTERDLVL